ncbi:TetR/AcrR family transcriptional regulator [Streptomyces pactum]|uniref:TetR/AcrR family transcriptional regulator n=1 Tax=Streptomyces pactum TaxID=68249 RepID=UPI0036F4ED82
MSTAPGPRTSDERLPLRARKKLRTRQALIDTALRLFTERGFDRVTLDELCDAVEVSKRTFFRTFTSKEDVAMAPTQDLWAAFLADLETRRPAGGTLLEMLRDALLAALGSMTEEGWAERVRLSGRLIARNPSMDAHGRQFCERTCRSAVGLLHRHLGFPGPDGTSPEPGAAQGAGADRAPAAVPGPAVAAGPDGAAGEAGAGAGAGGTVPGDLRVRLAFDLLNAVFHRALEDWTAMPGEPTREDLAARVREAYDALPGTLALRPVVRPGPETGTAPEAAGPAAAAGQAEAAGPIGG